MDNTDQSVRLATSEGATRPQIDTPHVAGLLVLLALASLGIIRRAFRSVIAPLP